MITEHAQTADLDRNTEVVLRFMRLMDSRDFDALDEVLAHDLRLQLGAARLDRVVLRTTNRAIHSGDFQGIPPTGRSITFGQIAIYRMDDGKISEIWEEADLFGLMQQLGVTFTR